MNDVQVVTDIGPGLATVNHAASSYGRPVVVVDGVAYGPAEIGLVDLPALDAPDLPAMYQALAGAGYSVRI
jgi:hypothetical protein